MQNVYQTKHGKAASRRRILHWINNNLHTSFMSIEELRSGAEYCVMLHNLQPSAINLKQVFMKARCHYQYVHNMRLLQKSLLKQGVEKQIPIQRLVSRGNLENLQFAQWFKAFYDLNYKLLRDEKTQDAEYSAKDVMKTGVKPQTKCECHPESFVDTEEISYESRCRHYSRSTSQHSNQQGKNIENYQRCGCGSYRYSKPSRRDQLRYCHYFRMAHSLYDILGAVNTKTAHINSALNAIRTYLIKKYRALNSRFFNMPTRLMTKGRYLQNKEGNWQVRFPKSENQNSETSPSKDEPGIFLDVEDPSISMTNKIDVPDEQPTNEPHLFQSPQSISTQLLDDLHSSCDNLSDTEPFSLGPELLYSSSADEWSLNSDEGGTTDRKPDDLNSNSDNLSDKEQLSLGPELHYSSSADEWSLNSDEGCTADVNPESVSTQIVKDSDDVPLSLNLETFNANEEDQSTSRHDIHKAEMDKQAITENDLGSNFDKASDRNLYSSTNNNLNYSEDSNTLFQTELESDMPIPFAIVRSKSQSSHENISENTTPIIVIDFQKHGNQSNICNSANISTTDEVAQYTEIDLVKKMDPKRCKRCKNSNGELLGNRLAHGFYRSRHFKLRPIGGFPKQKNLFIKSLEYLIRNLKVDFPAISAVEECSSDNNFDVVDLRQSLECVFDNLQKNLKHYRKILNTIYCQKRMGEEIN